jgi:hypothetical protein
MFSLPESKWKSLSIPGYDPTLANPSGAGNTVGGVSFLASTKDAVDAGIAECDGAESFERNVVRIDVGYRQEIWTVARNICVECLWEVHLCLSVS